MERVDYTELKKGGFMRQVQPDHFSLRLRIVGGQINSEQLLAVCEVSKKYGQGYVHMTSRQGMEIPCIKLADIESVKQELAKSGVQAGACGARVRTITACQGNTICPSGLIDTTTLAQELDDKYFARDLPHKFKIGITGCRNNCLKAEENDLGIKGGMKPKWDEAECIFCGLCETVCPAKVISINQDEQQLSFKESGCNYCGRCVKICPTDAWQGQSGFIVSFGGLFGNRISVGKQILPIIFSTELLHQVIEATLIFFDKHGQQGERFANTLDRVGWDLLAKDLEDVVK